MTGTTGRVQVVLSPSLGVRMPRCRLTTWYYARGIDDALHRVPARVPEQLLLGSEDRAGPPRAEWVRDGTVALLGVVVAMQDRRPWAFMGWGGGLLTVTSDAPRSVPIEERQEVEWCDRLARTAGHRAGAAPELLPRLTAFFIGHRMQLPVLAAKSRVMDLGLAGFLYNWSASASAGRWDLWDIATGQVLPGWDRRDELAL